MSTNDQNERLADKDGRFVVYDSEGAPDDELSQDELNNVSGGLARMKTEQQPDGKQMFSFDGKAYLARPSDDPSDPGLG